jgi:Kdo2-lipid IVA lauroyltransferase/acyltransferase
MHVLLYWLAALGIKTLQALPLPWVARFGRSLGALAYWIDTRHRLTALENLTRCFAAQLSPLEIRTLAQENFRRLGENYCCAVKTAAMSWTALQPHVEFVNTQSLLSQARGEHPRACIVAIGHFGNFELYARFGEAVPGLRCATTYRALNQPGLNRLLQSMRERSRCLFFERRRDANALKQAFSGTPPLLLGLLTDQHAGRRGIHVPFLGHECSTTPAPAILALRYNCALFTGICYRVGLARWRIEAGDLIPTRVIGQPRPSDAITRDINAALERAVHRDPANWFWVHKRWKPMRTRTSAVSTSSAKGLSEDEVMPQT